MHGAMFGAKVSAEKRTQLGHASHGPHISLITKRRKESLPKRLLPAHLAGPRRYWFGFSAQASLGGLLQQLPELARSQTAQWRRALPSESFRQSFRIYTQPKSELRQRRVQRVLKRHRRNSPAALLFPRHMKNDVSIPRVSRMRMVLPAGRDEIDFNIARHRWCITHLNHCVEKVRSSFVVPETGMEHSNALAIGSFELLRG